MQQNYFHECLDSSTQVRLANQQSMESNFIPPINVYYISGTSDSFVRRLNAESMAFQICDFSHANPLHR